jgi:hypothetical protein
VLSLTDRSANKGLFGTGVATQSTASGGWQDALVVFDGPSGYSSLTTFPQPSDHLIHPTAALMGVLYEKSEDGIEPLDFESIELALFTIV